MKRFVSGILSCVFATVVFMFCAMGVANADAKFTLTTTDGQTTFDFALSVFGTFDVDCGDGGVLSGTGVSGTTITRTNISSTTYTCTWETAGVHTIGFDGTATNYNTSTSIAAISFNVNGAAAKIASIDGNLSAIFPYMSGNAVGGAQPRFYQTFYNATNLTSIPATLFANYTSGAQSMFYNTFYGCTGLTSLPSDLFSRITSVASYMFQYTFSGCTNLGCETVGCSTGTGYIPKTLFAGITPRGSKSTNTMGNTFQNTKFVTTCPTGTVQYVTGWEGSSTWNSKVSCEPAYTCASGQYLPANSTNCVACPSGNFCQGGEYPLRDVDQGAIPEYICTSGQYVPAGANGCSPCKSGSVCPGGTYRVKDVTLDYGIYSFFVTTTTEQTTFSFDLSATGTFNVDCGDGGVLSGTGVSGATITRSNTTNAIYTCSWDTAGEHTILFGGKAISYNTSTSIAAISFSRSVAKIASIDGNLSAIFPYTSSSQPRFYRTFYNATNLTYIPETLFADYTKASAYMFYYTFQNCTGLTSIPENLFSKITNAGASMFNSTFYGCTNLGCETAGCSTGTGYIPPSTFAGLIANNHPGASSMWYNTFGSTKLVTECPVGTVQYVTGYEGTAYDSTWGGKVSCTDGTDGYGVTYTCGDGTGDVPSDVKRYASGIYVTTLTNTCITPSGKIFVKWSCAGNDVNAGKTFKITADTTCTAQYSDAINITYACGDGSGSAPNDSNNPYFSGATARTLSNTCIAPANSVFTGWSCGENTVAAGGTFTITDDTTCTAQWSVCATCDTTNASCTFDGVVNNVCTYTTSCNDGYYKITNNGSYNASCLPCGDIKYYCTGGVRTAVSARYYSTGGTETTRTGQSQCESGYYCANGARNECPSGYENSAAGATAANQCYRACSTANFEHSITVSGNDYYDNGKDTCTAETCESGYVTQLVSADLSTLDTSINGTAYGYVNNSGSTTSATPYGLTSSNINTWGVLFSYGKVLGESSCKASYYSTQTGQYCYCRVSGYVGGDTDTSRLTGTILPASFDTWNYRTTYNSTGACTSSCAYNCAYEARYTASYRSQLFNAAGSGVSQCVPETYNITYVLDGGTNYNNAPTTYEYAAGATINGAPTKPGTIFAGWCTDEQLQNCAMSQTIGTSATGDKTFYAKWTECEAGYYCENNVKTKCPSGYDNSVAGAVAANQCYHACTTSNVKHSTTVSGNDYYDNGKDTCTAETCETGYVMQSTVDLNSLNLDSMSSYGYITTNYNSVGKDTYGLINEYTWGASFNSGKLIGESLCSITSGTANQPGNPDTNTTDQYCWCRATGWVDGDTHVSRLTGTIQPISHPTWVLLGSASSLGGPLPPAGGGNMSATSRCSWNCVYYCVYNLQGNSVFRRSIVTADGGDTINRCFATITYVLNGGTNYSDAPVGYEEGNGTIVNSVPTKEGAVFAGWCTDAELQNCAMSQTIDKNATGNKTFYAKWTECSACSPTNASCTFDGIVNNVCTYTTSCNTGYGNIQNNGKYNASCSLSTYNITYDLTGGVSCIAYCNLFDNQWAQGGGYWYNDNNGNYSKRIHAVNLIPVTPNTTYTVSRTGNLRLAVQQYANTVKSSTSNPYLQDSGWVSSSTTTYTFTTLSNTRYVWLQLSSNNYSTDITPANGEATNVQFELGNVAHAFVPYVENCNAATVGNNCGTNYANAPTTYTFGTGATINGVPTKEDAVFAGWCTDEQLQNCAMSQTVSASDTGDKTFYAKWTECPACAATNASCTFDGVVDNVCTYTTSCNTGYGDIQNNGQYNASCSANDITLVYHDEEGNEISTGSCEYGTTISLPDAPAKQGYKFKGWTVVPAE